MKAKFEFSVMADHIRITEWITEKEGKNLCVIKFAYESEMLNNQLTKAQAIERAKVMVSALNKMTKVEMPYYVYNYETNTIEKEFDNEIEAEVFASQFKNADVILNEKYEK